jgi:uncharacterized protein YehS (DUF1456 family)
MIMIKTILAAVALTVALSSGADAAMMKKMDHMAMKKCGKGMMMMHGKCAMDHMMKKK